MTLFQAGSLYLAALGFALMGAGALVWPERVTVQFGIPTLSLAGRNEVRAVYGGFGLTMSLMLLLAVSQSILRPGICLTLAAALGGMVLGRILSAVVDRKIDGFPLLYLFVETVLAGLLVVSAR